MSGRTYGSLTLTRTAGAATYTAAGGSALTVRGSFLMNAGVTYTSTMTGAMNVAGDFTNNGASLTLPAGQAVNFNGTPPQTIAGSGTITFGGVTTVNTGSAITLNRSVVATNTFTVNGGLITGTNAITGAGTFTLASGASLAIGDPNGITSSGATGNIQTTTRNFNTAGNYTYNGTAAQVTGNGLPSFVHNITFDNAAGVTLSQGVAADANGTIFLNNGLVNTTSTNLLISQNSSAAFPPLGGTPGPTTYVNGPLNLFFQTSSPGRTFPVGKGGSYNPISISAINITSQVAVTGEVFTGSTGGTAGTGMSAINSDRYWSLFQTVGLGQMSNLIYTLEDSSSTVGKVVGLNATASPAAPYNSIGGNPSGNVIFSTVPTNSLGFLVIGTPATAAPPTVTTDAASLVTSTTASLNGTANPNGDATTGYFRYATTSPGTCNDTFGTRAPLSGGTALGAGTSAAAFSNAISSLTPGTTYFYCGIASNSFGTSFGAVLGFTTLADAPTVTTNAATLVTTTTATLNGSANPGGAATTGWFRYSTTSPGTCNDTFGIRAPASGGSALGSGNSAVPYSQALTGLTDATTYFYCAIAQNSVGTSFGSVQSFTTPAVCVPPSVTYVDDDWVGTAIGADPDGGGPATNFGCNSFATVQGGVSGVTTGGTVNVASGTYNEAQVLIDRSMTVLGAGSAATTINGGNITVADAGMVRINTPLGDTGNTTFSGFTLTNPGLRGASRYHIFAKPIDPASTVTVSNNKIIGVNLADYGLYSDRPVGTVVINNNEITNNAFNPILIERPVGSTNVHHNTIAGVGAGVTSIFNFTYSGNDVTTLQRVADNTINGSNATAISINGASPAGGGLGRYTSVQVTNNVITSVGASRIGVSLTNGAASGSELLGAIENPVVSGNIITGTDLAGSKGIRLSGLITNAAITGNDVRHIDRGFSVDVANGHSATGTQVHFNHFVTNPNGLVSSGPALVNAENNWWGCNAGPGNVGCDPVTGNVDVDPWIVLQTTALPTNINQNGTSAITADMRFNSASANTSGSGTVPNVPVAFTATQGTMLPTSGTVTLGTANSTFTSTSPANGTACATVDNQQTCTNITVILPPVVTTAAATLVTTNTATLNGSANPNGAAATGWFRYSTTSPGTCNDTFGIRAPASGGTSLGSGSSPVAFSEPITGLNSLTTYYYCAIASNTAGTGFGSVQSFTTGAETGASVSGGALTISDDNGGTSADVITLSCNATNLRINDPGRTIGAGAGTTQVDANTVDVPIASLTSILINTLAGNDTVNLNFSGGCDFIPTGGLTFNGGDPTSGSGDKLNIIGGSATTQTFNFTNEHDGSVVLAGGTVAGTISYTGLEPVSSTVTAANVVLNYSAVTETITVSQNVGTPAQTLVDSNVGGESVSFVNPTASLEINGGDTGDDTIDVSGFGTSGGGFNAGLTINGGTGNDTVNLNTNITFAAGNSLDVDLINDNASPGVDTINVGTSVSLQLSGAGTATLNASRNVTTGFSSSVTTTNGNVTITANPVGTTTGAFTGVSISGTVEATGSGKVTVAGKGGNSGSSQYGVVVNGGIVRGGTGPGLKTEVTGTGASNNTIGAHGVFVNDFSSITSIGGDVLVTGTGGAGGGGTDNYGVIVFGTNGFITSGGTGAVTVNGFGGSAASKNFGVIPHSGGTITSGGSGAVIVNGTGGPGVLGVGVEIFRNGKITSGGGTVNVTGTSPGSDGVLLTTDVVDALITSGGGAVTVTGVPGPGAVG
ncbi:MAG TPA: right-handed parallel beta-helix repeat-containing protein, partial [Pyrinomonadaceae bacterium]|nr:right-handed parallel beta-helix repeat-containing protein [Pyrinomonadaceae bacterium]